ncbi:hypothetical protein [Mobiluncus mulieris]|nr:hypothetical protein [Mobiluncus mulieris]
MSETRMLKIGDFSNSVGAKTGEVQLLRSKGFTQEKLIQQFSSKVDLDKKQEAQLGRKVSIDYMYQKLQERNIITEEETKKLRETVRSKKELAEEIYLKYGPGDESASASNMAEGVLLSNGIIVDPDDKEGIRKLSKLSRKDVSAVERILSCDYSSGCGTFHLRHLAKCRESGIIQGELSLQHFSVMKFILNLNSQDGSEEPTLMKESIKRLYEVLNLNEIHDTSSIWQPNMREKNEGLASIKF